MRHCKIARVHQAIALLVLGLAGCGEEPENVGPVDEVGQEKTMEGLSRDEIREHAEAVSPEQAENLGIVDSTIFLEDPTIDLDTILPVQTPPPGPL
jgi:hypothetical protein